MLRRVRRPLTLLAPVLLVSALVASCGGSDGDGRPKTSKDLDAVSITGDVGAEPTVDWNSRMTAGDPKVETLVEGDGPPAKKGGKVLVNYTLLNGYTQKPAVDTFGADSAGFLLTVGTPTVPKAQDANTVTAADLTALFISTQIKAGVTRGSRLAITVNSSNMFGQYLAVPAVAKADIGNDDGMLVVADVLDTAILSGPKGTEQTPDASTPSVTTTKGNPSGFDFTGAPKPDDKLHTTVLTKGDGEDVEKGDLIVVNYLGQVYQGDKPFDESFTTKEPLATPIGLEGGSGVIPGWDKGLVGQSVGSRVVLQIPPDLGYGDQGSGETIPPKSTLYFVIDILAAV